MASALRVVAFIKFAVILSIICGTTPVFSEDKNEPSRSVDVMFGMRFDYHQTDKIVISDGVTRSESSATDLSDAFGFSILAMPYVRLFDLPLGISFSYDQTKHSTRDTLDNRLDATQQMSIGLTLSRNFHNVHDLFESKIVYRLSAEYIDQRYSIEQMFPTGKGYYHLRGARLQYQFGTMPINVLFDVFHGAYGPQRGFPAIPMQPQIGDLYYLIIPLLIAMSIEIGIEGEICAMTGEILDADASGVGYQMMPYIGLNFVYVQFYFGFPYGKDAYGNNDNNDAGIFYKRSPGVEYILRVNIPF